jgi:hypothetical protein
MLAGTIAAERSYGGTDMAEKKKFQVTCTLTIGQVTIDGVEIVASKEILNRLKKAHKEVA